MDSNIKIVDEGMVEGSFTLFSLDNVSYYPTRKISSMVALNIYGVDLNTKGLFDSEKYREDEKKNLHRIDPGNPLSHCDVDADFLLFLPTGKPAWGLMDIRSVFGRRPEINLSLISSATLMPHRLNIKSGSVSRHHSLFNVIDRDGSRWTLHCKDK
jgi:hypothetical protein